MQHTHFLLLFADFFLLALMTLFIFIAWRFNKKYRKGIKEWCLAFLCATINLLLFFLYPPVAKEVSALYLQALLMMTGLFAYQGCRSYIDGNNKNHKYFYMLIAFATLIGAYFYELNHTIGFIVSNLVAGGFFLGAGITLLQGGFANHPIRYGLSAATILHGIFTALRPLLFTSSVEVFLKQSLMVDGLVIILFEQIIICPVLGLLVMLLMNEESLRLLRVQAEYDYLTHLRNRGSFYTQLRKAANLSTRLKTPLSVLVIDIDHFKSINDKYGHLTGDEALKTFARSAEQCIRDGDSAGRIGGEEFSIFLMNTSAIQAKKIAERLQKLLAESPLRVDGREINYTVSIGISCFDGTQSIESLISIADQALYTAKKDGRNKIRLAT